MEKEKITCVNCGKEITDLEKGCPYCNRNNSYNKSARVNSTSKGTTYTNRIARKFNFVVKLIRAIFIIAGLFGGFLVLEAFNILAAIIYFSALLIFAWFAVLLYEAIAEIIQLLDDIKKK